MKKLILAATISAILIGALLFLRPSMGISQEATQDFTSQVIAKLDEVIRGQKDILAQLGDIRKELDVIRVRASRK